MSYTKLPRVELLAISIQNGIIQALDDDGNMLFYRQRGIQTLTKAEIAKCVKQNYLDREWKSYPELPRNCSIYFEDTEIMGKPLATYPYVLLKNREKRAKKRAAERKTHG